MSDIKSLFEFVLLGAGVASIFYRVAKAESAIYVAIDSLKDTVNDRFSRLESLVKLDRAAAQSSQEMINYRVEVVESKLDERVRRLKGMINQIIAYLEKHSGFISRNVGTEPDSRS